MLCNSLHPPSIATFYTHFKRLNNKELPRAHTNNSMVTAYATNEFSSASTESHQLSTILLTFFCIFGADLFSHPHSSMARGECGATHLSGGCKRCSTTRGRKYSRRRKKTPTTAVGWRKCCPLFKKYRERTVQIGRVGGYVGCREHVRQEALWRLGLNPIKSHLRFRSRYCLRIGGSCHHQALRGAEGRCIFFPSRVVQVTIDWQWWCPVRA